MAGLRVRNPHDLRHTYATIFLMAHQSPAYVQKQLGHSLIKTTVDIYGHWILGEGRGGLDEALGGLVEQKRDKKCIFLHIFAYRFHSVSHPHLDSCHQIIYHLPGNISSNITFTGSALTGDAIASA